MIWLRRSPSGLSSTGFIRAVGATRQAAACTATLRAISPPSAVTAALLLMFCALKGATRIPRRAAMRQSAVTRVLLPTDEAVPRTISTGAVIVSPSLLVAPHRPPRRVSERAKPSLKLPPGVEQPPVL